MSRKAKSVVALVFLVGVLTAVILPHFVRVPQGTAINAYTNSVRLIKEWKSKLGAKESTASFRSDGFSHMESYVDLLLHSQNESASVIVATIEKPRMVTLKRQAGRTLLSVWLDGTGDEIEQAKTREFFSQRGIPVFKELRSANPPANQPALGYEFQLDGDSKSIARLCVSVFTDLYVATDQYGSSFTYFGL